MTAKKRTLPSDIVHAARLDGNPYAEARDDARTTARGLPALAALAHGAGGVVRATAFERDPPPGSLLIGFQGEVLF